jgi:hypothetical protein
LRQLFGVLQVGRLIGLRLLLHLAEIRARTEDLAGAGDLHHAHRLIVRAAP